MVQTRLHVMFEDLLALCLNIFSQMIFIYLILFKVIIDSQLFSTIYTLLRTLYTLKFFKIVQITKLNYSTTFLWHFCFNLQQQYQIIGFVFSSISNFITIQRLELLINKLQMNDCISSLVMEL